MGRFNNQNAQQKKPGKKGSGVWDQIGAFAQSATEQIPFLDEAAAGTVALATGRPYKDVRRVQADLAQEDREERPLARNAGGVAGFGATLAAPGGGYIKGAKTFGGAVSRSAQVGAAYGALAGAGAADGGLGERAKGAAKGAVVGGAAGAAVPAAVKGAQAIPGAIRRTGSGLSEAGSRIAQQFGREAPEAVVTPEAARRAEDYVARMAASRGVTPSALTADPAVVAGKPITAAEALGRSGMGQLTAIGRRSGRTPDELEALLAARADEAGARLVDDFSSVSGIDPSTAADDFAAMTEALRKTATPAYDAAYAMGGLDSPQLQILRSRPSVQRAMARAVRIAAEEGRDPAELGFQVVKRGAGSTARETATYAMPEGAGGRFQVTGSRTVHDPQMADVAVQVENPTAQTWDYVKRGMDDILESYRDPTTRRLNLDTEGRAIVGTHGELRGELIERNPAYGEALARGGEPLRLEQAWRDAPGLMNARVSERVFGQRWAQLTDAEKQAFMGGFANDLFEKARSGRLRPKEFRNPAFRKKLTSMLGPESAMRFVGSVEQEMRLARGARMSPGTNSVTEEVRQASKELDRGTGFMADLQRRLDGGQSPLTAVPASVGSAVAAPIAGFVRGAQAPLNQATRDEVGRLLMLPPEELARILGNRPQLPQRGMFGARAVPAVSNYAGSR